MFAMKFSCKWLKESDLGILPLSGIPSGSLLFVAFNNWDLSKSKLYLQQIYKYPNKLFAALYIHRYIMFCNDNMLSKTFQWTASTESCLREVPGHHWNPEHWRHLGFQGDTMKGVGFHFFALYTTLCHCMSTDTANFVFCTQTIAMHALSQQSL